MNVDADHNKHEEISLSSMHSAVCQPVVVKNASVDSFSTASILIDEFPFI